MEIISVDVMPPLVRGGGRRSTEEHTQILEALQSFKPQKVSDIEDRKVHNSLQQRVRGVARKYNITVEIRYVESEKATYFKALTAEELKARNEKVSTSNTSEAEAVDTSAAKTRKNSVTK